jgi:hypothetical protein
MRGAVRVVGDVGRDGEGAELLRGCLHLLARARCERELEAVLFQRLRDREPDPGRSTRDQRGSAHESSLQVRR